MEFIIALAIGIAWGWWAREKHAEKQVNKIFSRTQEKLEELEERELQNRIVVEVEKHGDIFYLFNAETGEFVAQGKDMDEIRDFVTKKYMGKKSIMINRDHANDMGLL